MKQGWLLALEGLDGSGKSTQAARLVTALREAGHAVVATREPTGGEYGQRLRALPHAAASDPPDARDELRWFVEDRREHVARVIAPALRAGRVVVTDRYFLSSVAYQGARGADTPERILARSEEEFPLPDLALVLVVEAGLGLARTRARGGAPHELFEHEALLRRVAEVYASLERPYLERVDASGSADAVHSEILARVRARTDLL